MSPLLMCSATELAARMRRRELSPVDVIEAYIARIEEVNGALNALVESCFDRARDDARRAEAKIMASRDPGELPPLLGVPCTIKEFIAVEGMYNTAGLLSRRHVRATRDATVVQRLRAAGAVILGIGNVPEAGLWVETYNKIYGRTNNPWDLRCTAGGSSGGEAALVASGASAFGIGSDFGGSIRIPAAFCGIAGHKPTGRMVPNTGHWAVLESRGPYLCLGPMARRVCDLVLVLDVIAGSDDEDPCTRPWARTRRQPDDLSGVVVYALEDAGAIRTSEVMRQQVRRAADALRARGATIRALHAPLLSSLHAIWSVAMFDAGAAAGAPSVAELLGDGTRIRLGSALARMLLGRAQLTMPSLAAMTLEAMIARMPGSLLARQPRPAALQAQLEAQLGANGVMLLPPYIGPAPRHNHSLLKPFAFLGTALFNLVEFPATAVPTGLANGLPVGVQIAARRGNDDLTLAVAEALEQDFGPLPPPSAIR